MSSSSVVAAVAVNLNTVLKAYRELRRGVAG
jgi:DNA-binding transcriptional regulator YhcF (GntR family)